MAITDSINRAKSPRCSGGVDGFEDEVVTIMCAEKRKIPHRQARTIEVAGLNVALNCSGRRGQGLLIYGIALPENDRQEAGLGTTTKPSKSTTGSVDGVVRSKY